MPRVAVFDGEYNPLAMLFVDDRALEMLRLYGWRDPVRVILSVQINWNTNRNTVVPPVGRYYTGTVQVEGMRWANGEVKPIIVCRFPSEAFEDQERGGSSDVAHDLLDTTQRVVSEAITAAYRHGNGAYYNTQSSSSTAMEMRSNADQIRQTMDRMESRLAEQMRSHVMDAVRSRRR